MIQKTQTLPENSLLKGEEARHHYTDSFKLELVNKQETRSVDEMLALFFASGPKWGDRLMTLRNKIAGALGLKTSDTRQAAPTLQDIEKCRPGDRLGIFKMLARSPYEVVLGENDKHLNFKVSFLCHPAAADKGRQSFCVTTLVHYNNALGRIYFFPVKPFHRLIIQSTLKQMERLNATWIQQELE